MNRPTVVTVAALAVVVVLTAAFGVLVLEVTEVDEGVTAAEGAAAPSTTTTTAAPGAVPARGQLRVEGLLGGLDLRARFETPLPAPLTFVPAARGSGNGGELRSVIVGDDLTNLIWDGGRNLVVDGNGGFSFDRAPIRLVDGVLTIELGEVVGDIAPGTYDVQSPVAVGRAGLAQPRDRVSFVVGATEASTIAFRGAVSTTIGPDPPRLLGPGTGTLSGTFTVTRPDGTTGEASTVTLGPDTSFEIEVAGLEGGWIVNALFQGDVAVG